MKNISGLSAIAGVLFMSSCQTVPRSQPAFASLRVESSEIVLQPPSLWFRFTFVNTTATPISGYCSPELEAKVADKWVTAFQPVVLGCDRSSFGPGESYTERFPIFGYVLQNGIDLRRGSESGDNLYRLRWEFVEGKDAVSQSARRVHAFSNAFRIIIRTN